MKKLLLTIMASAMFSFPLLSSPMPASKCGIPEYKWAQLTMGLTERELEVVKQRFCNVVHDNKVLWYGENL